MAFGSPQWMYASGEAFTLDQSLRFNDNDSANLSRTPASAGNRSTWTWSGWLKRGNLGLGDWRAIFVGTNSSGNTEGLFFHGSDQLLFMNGGGSYTTTAKYRDCSSWYHFVAVSDNTQGTAGDRMKLYVNGVRVTAFSSSTNPSQSATSGFVNDTRAHYFFSGDPMDGYLAEVHFIDGTALTPTSFGETGDYGEWKPILVTDTSGASYTSDLTYGTNGFYLPFDSTSALGADRSPNDSNHWTVNNITGYDQMVDSPTNNFCTLNPLLYPANLNSNSLKEGNLQYGGGSTWGWTQGTMMIPKDQVVYFEMCRDGSSGRGYGGIALQEHQTNSSGSRADGFINGLISSLGDDLDWYFPTRTIAGTGSTSSISGNYMADIIGVVVDQANSTVKFYASNTLRKTITNADCFSTTGDYVPFAGGALNTETIMNFGQDSSFNGNFTAQGNTDSNGYGDFYYTPPAGIALCTSNLPAVAVVPSENFNAVLYTGDGNSTHAITGVGFQPDFLWIKNRSAGSGHTLQDVLRTPDATIYSQTSEGENATRQYVYSFDSDGFTTGNAAGAHKGPSNNSGDTYVGWNWKAGGSGSSNTNGGLTSQVSANTDAGFSIVTFTGNGSGNTVGHGLSKAPEMVITKGRNFGDSWHTQVYPSIVATKTLLLDTTGAETTSNAFNNTAPTASVFSISTGYASNTRTIVAYCFHSVDGYSKVGAYTGNDSTNGPFVYTGFRPAWVMTKSIGTGNSWWIIDNKRDTYNEADAGSRADNVSAEMGTYMNKDLLANGFKIRTSNGQSNGSNSGTPGYIFIAFAETPFKYANAR